MFMSICRVSAIVGPSLIMGAMVATDARAQSTPSFTVSDAESLAKFRQRFFRDDQKQGRDYQPAEAKRDEKKTAKEKLSRSEKAIDRAKKTAAKADAKAKKTAETAKATAKKAAKAAKKAEEVTN
ncbi:MAG: hypothetical protein HKO95_13450 [Rhodobacteraceae bacterium]|nr:hypothetical protein [Alphaproteobacteria bacterium]NNF71648.1 hypothetical protein [Paracoccaceae bacterium]NNK67728.1 hypothetical protein [Paracoccaceae bacterium]